MTKRHRNVADPTHRSTPREKLPTISFAGCSQLRGTRPLLRIASPDHRCKDLHAAAKSQLLVDGLAILQPLEIPVVCKEAEVVDQGRVRLLLPLSVFRAMYFKSTPMS